jgi:hypothetical protein
VRTNTLYARDLAKVSVIYFALSNPVFTHTGELNDARDYWYQIGMWKKVEVPNHKMQPFPIVPDPLFTGESTARR